MADQELTFAEKIKTLQFATGKSRNNSKEYRDESGHWVRKTRDDATTRGNITVEHAKGDRQDVIIRPDLARRPVTDADVAQAKEDATAIRFEKDTP